MELLNRDVEGPLENVVPFGAPNGPLGKLNTRHQIRTLRTAQAPSGSRGENCPPVNSGLVQQQTEVRSRIGTTTTHTDCPPPVGAWLRHGACTERSRRRTPNLIMLTRSLTVLLLLLAFPNGVRLAKAGGLDAETRTRAARYEPIIASAARRHGVDPRVLWTIAYLETRFRPHLVSPARAAGLMQFIPSTARRFGLANPFDPEASIDAAARYVRFLSRQFGGRLDLVLAGYNAGEGAVAAFRDGRTLKLPNGRVINPRAIRTGGVPPYRETRGYVASGRAVFAGLAMRGAFGRSDTSSDVEPARVATPAELVEIRQDLEARSIYFGDDGPHSRAVELPDAHEIEGDLLVSGERGAGPETTRSIVFGPAP